MIVVVKRKSCTHQRVRLLGVELVINLNTDPRGPAHRLPCFCALASQAGYLATECGGLKGDTVSLTIQSAAFHVHAVVFKAEFVAFEIESISLKHQSMVLETHVSLKLCTLLALN
jgi:hypothetical protein